MVTLCKPPMAWNLELELAMPQPNARRFFCPLILRLCGFQALSLVSWLCFGITNCFGQSRQSVMNWRESRWVWYAGFYGGLLAASLGRPGLSAGALAQRCSVFFR